MLTPANICSRCGKRLGPQAIRAAGKQFHPACFICDSCHKPLEKSLIPRGDRLYHPECHERLFVPRCNHCGERIQDSYIKDAQGRYHASCYQQLHQLICSLCGEALAGPYLIDGWGQKAHPSHSEGPTGQCHVCARLMTVGGTGGHRQLSDGRLLCVGCHATEVQDFRQIQAAKLEVIAQMQAVGFDYIPDYIQVILDADQQLLNERLRASATGNIHGFTRSAQRHIPGYGLILEHSIHVMSGLPRLVFMGVLAHELLHVWINERPLGHLRHEQIEGFCNLGTALIYHNASTQADRELAQVLLERMETDPDPAYGEGYRTMAWHLEKMGWPTLLQALHQQDTLWPQPEARVLTPRQRPEKSARPEIPSLPSAPSLRSAEKLAEIRTRLQSQRAQSPVGSSPAAAVGAMPAELSAPRPASDPAMTEKIRARFAQKEPLAGETTTQNPGQKKPISSSRGSKLGKLKKSGSIYKKSS